VQADSDENAHPSQPAAVLGASAPFVASQDIESLTSALTVVSDERVRIRLRRQ
jgi:hypothetical protein